MGRLTDNKLALDVFIGKVSEARLAPNECSEPIELAVEGEDNLCLVFRTIVNQDLLEFCKKIKVGSNSSINVTIFGVHLPKEVLVDEEFIKETFEQTIDEAKLLAGIMA